MEKVNSGVIKEISNAISTVVKTVSDSFFKLLDRFPKYGIEVLREDHVDDTDVKLQCKYGSKRFSILIHPIMDDNGKKTNKINLTVTINGKDYTYEDIDELDVEDTATKALKEAIKVDMSSEPVSECKRMVATFQKVTSNDESTINLMYVSSSYNVYDSTDLLDSITNDDEFADTITEDPQSFVITDLGDEIDIDTYEPCEDDTIDCFMTIFSAAMNVFGAAMALSVIPHSDLRLEEFIRESQYKITTDMELLERECVNTTAMTINPIKSINCSEYYEETDCGIELLKMYVEVYIDILEFYLCNFIDCYTELESRICDWRRILENVSFDKEISTLM